MTRLPFGFDRRLRGLFMATAAVVSLCAADSSFAQTSFQGATIRLYAGSGPGGGVGLFGLPLLPYLTKYLPGNPRIVEYTMAGGGGVEAAQHTYNVASRDGVSISLLGPGPIGQPFLSSQKVNYDVAKFNWIGSMTSGATSCFVNKKVPVQTIEDAQKKQVSMSVTGIESGGSRVARLINGLIGTKFKTIAGYNGTADTMLAVERVETDGSCLSFGSLRTSGILDRGVLRILIQATIGEKEPGFENVPSLIDLVKTEEDRQAIQLLLTPYEIQNIFLLPPGVPQPIIDIWRKAFDQAIRDPAYLKEAERLQQQIMPRSGPEVAQLIQKMADTPATVRERVIKLLTQD